MLTACLCRMDVRRQSCLLHELPDPCLEAILSCFTEEPRSLFSAALAHPRLHQAAVLALKDTAPSSIRVELCQRQDVKGMLLYMEQHGQNASSISLQGSSTANTVTLKELPHSKLQGLSRLELSRMSLQLSNPRSCRYHWHSDATGLADAMGVLGGDVPLKQLKLASCTFLDDIDEHCRSCPTWST